MNVVMYSPRRYGKTSLAKRVMGLVQRRGMVPIYVDFVGVTGVDDVAGRLAAKTYEYTRMTESVFKKVGRFLNMWQPVLRPDQESGIKVSVEVVGSRAGEKLLDDTLSGINDFSKSESRGCFIVLDEFQDITTLSNSRNIEGRMRSQIDQHSKTSYLYIGSRRRLLQDMFEGKDRAFYKRGLMYPIKLIPLDDFVKFIKLQFKSGHKVCSDSLAGRIVQYTEGYPYYTQKLAYFVYEISGKTVTDSDVSEAFEIMKDSEKAMFEVMGQSISNQQMALLMAIAREPTDSPYSAGYMRQHNLGSIGGIQAGLTRLLELDYIEKDKKRFKVVDPIFSSWLREISYQ